MALNFEYEKDLETGAQPYIAYEPDSTLYNYFVDSERAMDRNTFVEQGVYDGVEFTDLQRHLTTRAVSRIGIKHFPGIGAIGFYKDAYSFDNRIVAPIHSRTSYYKAPTLVKAEVLDGKLHVVIEPPDDITYNCYRIVARQGAFAFEYITYKLDYSVDLPTVRGSYSVYCIGYDEDNGSVSEDSNELTLEVPVGTSTWSPLLDETSVLQTDLSVLREKIEVINDRTDALEDNVLLLDEKTDTTDAHVSEVEAFVEESMDGIGVILDDINKEEV